MKQYLFLFTIVSLFILTGCTLGGIDESVNTVKESEHYQQAKQGVNSGIKYLGDKTNDFIENNTGAQKVFDSANQKLNEAQEEAIRLKNEAQEEAIRLKNQAQETAKQYGEKAQEEVKNQYGQIKENTKNSMKETINKKVDEAFDRI